MWSSLQHVSDQYEAMRPLLEALVTAYPSIIRPEHVSHDSYLWAVMLWYAYAMEVGLRLLAIGVTHPWKELRLPRKCTSIHNQETQAS